MNILERNDRIAKNKKYNNMMLWSKSILPPLILNYSALRILIINKNIHNSFVLLKITTYSYFWRTLCSKIFPQVNPHQI